MSIIKIAKTDVVRLQVNVSEADLAQVTIGQTMLAQSGEAPTHPITARISAIFPAQDPSARTAIVEARITNTGNRLKLGQYLSVELPLGSNEQPALSVPTSALIVRDGKSSVFVVANDDLRNTAKRVEVTTGRMSNARTEIMSGLKEGDQVITSGLANLNDGDAITVLQKGKAATTGGNGGIPPRASNVLGTDALPPPATPTPLNASKKHPSMTSMPMTGNSKGTATRNVTSKTGQPSTRVLKWYHCPMHPEVVSHHPGKCPKCGMDLVEFHPKE
jgi:hypothetical protein